MTQTAVFPQELTFKSPQVQCDLHITHENGKLVIRNRGQEGEPPHTFRVATQFISSDGNTLRRKPGVLLQPGGELALTLPGEGTFEIIVIGFVDANDLDTSEFSLVSKLVNQGDNAWIARFTIDVGHETAE